MAELINASDSLNEGREKLNAIAKEMNEKDVASMPEIVQARGKHNSLASAIGSKINRDSTDLTINMFNEKDRNILQGQTPGTINAVLGEGNVEGINVANEAITPQKIYKNETKNLLDPSGAVKNQFVTYTGTAAPYEARYRDSDSITISNKIYGTPGESFSVTQTANAVSVMVVFFNTNDEIIEWENRGPGDIKTFDFIQGASYFRVNIRHSEINIDDFVIAKTENFEEAGGTVLPWLRVEERNIGKDAIKNANLDGTIKENLLIKEKSEPGWYQGGTKVAGYSKARASNITLSNFVPCELGEGFAISVADIQFSVYFYESDEPDAEPIDEINTGSGKYNYGFTIENPEANFFRVNMRTTLVPLNDFIIVKGTNVTEAEKKQLKWLEITKDNLSSDFEFPDGGESPGGQNWYSHKRGKKLVTFGNSRTWYDGQLYGGSTKEPGVRAKGYQTYLREQLGLEINNVGVSGARIHQTVQTLKNYNFTGDEYAISLMHGTNNFNAVESGEPGYTFGEVDHSKSGNYDTMSYAGGLQEFVEWVSINLPWIKLYLMPDAWCYFSTHGGMPREYADVVKEIAELYHYPFLDVYHKCGFNENNMDYYFVDGGANQFHENTKGFERISEIIVPFIANH